ncbi:PQQ-binding-like beta-propeller repeat protein [Pseudactinotalea terrae]|uniref:outer membrane protein assembly factor BamB family protein n=1 Tax=Pseudactinotalea terrae TaxID=1743262 RepID=UPI0012E1C472|nr:PQQ-binding-like beta-propeller repeat protein [Pseudactinotalea terrae]
MTDDDEFEIGSEQPAFEAPPAHRRGPWLGTTPWVLAAAALVVTGVAVAPEEGLSLDGYPPGTVGMLAVDATAPPEEMWRAPIEGGHWGSQSLDVIGTTAVLLSGDLAVGFSLATGEQLWQVPVDIETCTVHEQLTCIERPGEPEAEAVRIDPITGDQLRTEVPYAVTAQDVDDDLIVLTQRDDELELLRVDAAGEPRWVTTVDHRNWMLGDMNDVALFAQLVVLGERVHLSVVSEGVVVDVTSGSTLEQVSAYVYATPYGYIRQDLEHSSIGLLGDDGGILHSEIAVAPDDDPGGRYQVRWDGSHLSVVSGDETVWVVENGDDGEMAFARVDGVLVTTTVTTPSDRLAGRDVRTGAVLWTTEGDRAIQAFAAAGSTLLMSTATDALTGVDAHSGEVLWTYGDAEQSGAFAFQPDGVVLLLGNEVVRLVWDRAATAVW